MRLLNTGTLKFKEFLGAKLPPYAIVSHVWSPEEISYAEFLAGTFNKESYGYEKIEMLCRLARNQFFVKLREAARKERIKHFCAEYPRHSIEVEPTLSLTPCKALHWCWIDTICIDKRSSAELSEAINSMYNYYEHSAICFIFLPDVESSPELALTKWLTRGWTLQETIAPRNKIFLNNTYDVIGCIRYDVEQDLEFANLLEEVSGIDSSVLRFGLSRQRFVAERTTEGKAIREEETNGRICVAQRMGWMSGRRTTREEDIAYGLLGLFDVNMPLLYGEGAEKAFFRLQIEILNQNRDDSLFAWDCSSFQSPGLLAPHPKYFHGCRSVKHEGYRRISPTFYTATQRGIELQISLPRGVRPKNPRFGDYHFLLPLNCYSEGKQRDKRNMYAIMLQLRPDSRDVDQAIPAKRRFRLIVPDLDPHADRGSAVQSLQEQAMGWAMPGPQLLENLSAMHSEDFEEDLTYMHGSSVDQRPLQRYSDMLKPAKMLQVYVLHKPSTSLFPV